MDWISILCMIFIAGLITFVIFANTVWSKESNSLDKKYNVSKFPVISLTGKQYFAEIKYNHENFAFTQFTCNIYKRVLKKHGKFKDEIVTNRGFDFSEVNYSHMKIVKDVIERYETECLKDERNENSISANKKLFEDWNGIIRNKEEV